MNCECIYYKKGATQDELLLLANAMECVSLRFGVEKNPVAISIITKDTVCTDDYDGFGKRKTIPQGSVVLFVHGKLHNMSEVYTENSKGAYTRKLIPLFPVERDEDFFEDIIDYTDEVFKEHCAGCKINCEKGC